MSQRQKERTQWTAQFLVAAELCRRGYVVTFTMGNCTQDYDLIVASPEGDPFCVDVKGLALNTSWFIRKKDADNKLYYILVRVDAERRDKDRFFIMTHGDVNKGLEIYYSKLKKDGTAKSDNVQEFNFAQAREYEDKWEILPHTGI